MLPRRDFTASTEAGFLTTKLQEASPPISNWPVCLDFAPDVFGERL